MQKNDTAISEYMKELPEYIQENIKQSGVKIESVEQLKKIVEGLNSK